MKTSILFTIIILSFCGWLFAADISDSYAQEENGNYASALQIMQELQKSDAAEPFYQMRIAWLQYLLGRYEDAISSYRRALSIKEHYDAHMGVINCQLALGRYQELISEVAELLKNRPQDQALMAKAAYAAYLKKDYATAASYYRMIISLYPWDMESRGYLVNNLFLAGLDAEGIQQYALLKKYYPRSSILALWAHKIK